MPSSRPKPDCLKPPNGVCTRTERVRVDREHAGLDRPRDAQRPRAVRRPDRAREPVRRVVREPDRLCLVRERDHRRDRAEDLLPRDAVVVRRLDERAREPEARAVRRLARKSGVAVDEGARPSRGAPPRSAGPSRSSSSLGIADLDRCASPRRAGRESGRRPMLSTRIRERAQQSWPALPKTAYGAAAAAALEVGVGEDDVRRLAAELERDALDRRGRARHHRRARPRSSR